MNERMNQLVSDECHTVSQNSLELGVDLIGCFVIVLIGHLVELGTLGERERDFCQN